MGCLFWPNVSSKKKNTLHVEREMPQNKKAMISVFPLKLPFRCHLDGTKLSGFPSIKLQGCAFLLQPPILSSQETSKSTIAAHVQRFRGTRTTIFVQPPCL